MTMVVHLRGGANATLETPMIIFTNANSSYPIQGVHNVPGAAYRSGPKGWMDRRVFCEWLKEDRCVHADSHGRTQAIFMDNAGGHKALEAVDDENLRSDMEAVMEKKAIKLRFLPANGTDLCQPADYAIIQKIKQVWHLEWCKYKKHAAMTRNFSNMPNKSEQCSGKLNHPGKEFYLTLAARCCRAVSAMRDDDGVSVVRKAMIRCGLNRNTNGVWEEKQLSPLLQALVVKHRGYFEGKLPQGFCEAIV